MLKPYLNDFIRFIQNTPGINLYNEAGLQHELGFYLKKNLPKKYIIELERNVSAITGTKKGFYKKELDIYITDGKNKYAVELKVPVNKQIPRQMELTFKDVRFMEQLKEKGVNECFLLFASLTKSFWESRRVHKIYEYFNDGHIQTLTKNDVPAFIRKDPKAFQEIKAVYDFTWKDFVVRDKKQWRCFLLQI